MGRQLFSPSEVDDYKCNVLMGRINRFFGLDWKAIPEVYNMGSNIIPANITISCVDSGPARKEIKKKLLHEVKVSRGKQSTPFSRRRTYGFTPYKQPYYWMDYGNMMDRGQVVIGTLRKIEQPKNSDFECVGVLPCIDKFHKDIFNVDKSGDQGPSCSLAEALNKQDLFINSNLANMGLGILWKLFREARIQYHGCYLNLETLSVNPIRV